MITQEQLDHWRALCAPASPEPWVVAPHESLAPEGYHRILRGVGTDVYAKGDCDTTADPVFAAAARNAFLALLDEVDRLNAVVESQAEDITHYANEPKPTVVEHSAVKVRAHNLGKEVERLRGLVRHAFDEGYGAAWRRVPGGAAWRQFAAECNLKGGEA